MSRSHPGDGITEIDHGFTSAPRRRAEGESLSRVRVDEIDKARRLPGSRGVLPSGPISHWLWSVLPSSSRSGSGLPLCRIRYSTGLPPAHRAHAAAVPSATSLVPFSTGSPSLFLLQFQSLNLSKLPRSTRAFASAAASSQPSSVVVRSVLMFVSSLMLHLAAVGKSARAPAASTRARVLVFAWRAGEWLRS